MAIKIVKKFSIYMSLIGPGLFLIGYNIGTGSVTSMAKAGADYGMTLFWALALSCFFTYILMVAYGKVTLVSDQTALFNIKKHVRYGSALALYIMIALILGEILSLMGIMGIVADLLQEAIRIVGKGLTIGTFSITTIVVILLFTLLYYGRYQIFEKFLSALVILMGICFLIVFFMVKPDFSTIVSGLIPRIPKQAGALSLIAAIVGTTCSAAIFVIRSIVLSEKGWGINDLKNEKRDAMVSATMMLFLSGLIMAVAAGTLHVMGVKLVDTLQMIELFQPIGGNIAALILIAGITGAALSSIFPIILIAPWLIADYTGKSRDIRSPLFRILGGIALLFSFGLQFIDEKPVAMMVFSMAFQAGILPAVTVPILILINNKSLMGKYVADTKTNLGIIAVLIFSCVTTYFAIADLV